MLERAVCRRRLLPAESWRSRPLDLPMLESLSAVSRMVALVSHDLRHPLTAILANAEFLTQTDISETERNELYQEIRCAVDRMNELVSSLLECSRGRETLRPGERNIVDTVDRAIRMTCVKQEFRGITIKHHHQGTAVGWFDSNRLERVVANLVLNACEAVSPDSGQIVITTTGDSACLQIGVWDNGPGIPPTNRGSVFAPFVSYGKANGGGLGLAIAKKIVEDHGGEINLDGRNQTGTMFKITIPFAIPDSFQVMRQAGSISTPQPIELSKTSAGMLVLHKEWAGTKPDPLGQGLVLALPGLDSLVCVVGPSVAL
jgi:signal transduction histidine kinase